MEIIYFHVLSSAAGIVTLMGDDKWLSSRCNLGLVCFLRCPPAFPHQDSPGTTTNYLSVTCTQLSLVLSPIATHFYCSYFAFFIRSFSKRLVVRCASSITSAALNSPQSYPISGIQAGGLVPTKFLGCKGKRENIYDMSWKGARFAQ